MKSLIAALLLVFTALLYADEYAPNDSPKVGEKGRITATVGKVVDNYTLQVTANGKTFIVKADTTKFQFPFKDTVNNEIITLAYVRTGTETLNENKVAVLAFVKVYTKEEREREEKEKTIKAEKLKTSAKTPAQIKAESEAKKKKMMDEINAYN